MGRILLKNVRLSFPDLFKPGAPPKDNPLAPPKYGAQLIFAPDSDAGKIAQAEYSRVATEEWGANVAAVLAEFGKNQKCLRRGDSNLDNAGAVRAGYAGMLFISARNKQRPAVIARNFHNGQPVYLDEDGTARQNNQIIVPPFAVKVPYGGAFVNATVDIYSSKKNSGGVFASLIGVQFHEDGEAFGGGAPSADGFEDMGDAPAAPGAAASAVSLF